MGAIDMDPQATSVPLPSQLPPILSLGTRDDDSFVRDGDAWSCLYRFEGAPFTRLAWDGTMWEITRFWQGRKIGVTHAPAGLTLHNAIALHHQYLSVDAADDPYEKLLKERTEAQAGPFSPVGWVVGFVCGIGRRGGRI